MKTKPDLASAALALAAVLACPAPCSPGRRRPIRSRPTRCECWSGCSGRKDAEDEQTLAAVEVSRKEEVALGREAVQAYLAALKDAKIRVVNRGRDLAYLRKLAETVRPLLTNAGSCPPLTIYLAETSRFEARSFSDGTLVFSRGLLEMAESEAAVIGMVGHELSHLDRRHHSTRLRRMKLAQIPVGWVEVALDHGGPTQPGGT